MSRDVDLEVFCAECGERLEVESCTFGKHYTLDLRIKPCVTCRTEAEVSGYSEGHDEGQDQVWIALGKAMARS